MADHSLSSLGAFAYLFNSFSAFSVFLIPYSITFSGYWYLPIIFVFALFSLLASSFIIGLTDLIMQERIGTGPSGQLLPVPPEQRNTEIDLPSLAREASSTVFGDTLYVIVVCCCLLGVVDMSLVGADLMSALECKGLCIVGYILGLTVCVTVLNMFDFVQLEFLHIAMAVCRVGYCVLRPFTRMPDNNDPWLLFPCLAAAFFYQLPLPGVLTAYKRSPKHQIWLQVAAITFYLCLYVGLTIAIDLNPTDQEEEPGSLFFSFYFAFKVLSPHIYWKTLGRIVIAWRYGTNLHIAKERHPKMTRAVEMFVHWPVYGLYLLLYFLVTKGEEQFYLNGFYPWVAFITLFLYWSIVHAYDQKIATFTQEELAQYQGAIAKWARVAVKCIFAVLSIVAVGYVVKGILAMEGKSKMAVGGSGVTVIVALGAMISWNCIGKRQ